MVDNFSHYVVFFYYNNKNRKYIIGDPAKGILKLDKEELDTIWQGQFCRLAIPDDNYKDICYINNYKKG